MPSPGCLTANDRELRDGTMAITTDDTGQFDEQSPVRALPLACYTNGLFKVKQKNRGTPWDRTAEQGARRMHAWLILLLSTYKVSI